MLPLNEPRIDWNSEMGLFNAPWVASGHSSGWSVVSRHVHHEVFPARESAALRAGQSQESRVRTLCFITPGDSDSDAENTIKRMSRPLERSRLMVHQVSRAPSAEAIRIETQSHIRLLSVSQLVLLLHVLAKCSADFADSDQ
jgi:hypothetical protein